MQGWARIFGMSPPMSTWPTSCSVHVRTIIIQLHRPKQAEPNSFCKERVVLWTKIKEREKKKQTNTQNKSVLTLLNFILIRPGRERIFERKKSKKKKSVQEKSTKAPNPRSWRISRESHYRARKKGSTKRGGKEKSSACMLPEDSKKRRHNKKSQPLEYILVHVPRREK